MTYTYHLFFSFYPINKKIKNTYGLAFKHFVDHCNLHGMIFAHIQGFLDFEIAIHIALESVWRTPQYEGADFIQHEIGGGKCRI